MTSHGRNETHVDADGVRTIRDPRAKWIVGLAGAASGLVIVAALVATVVLNRRRPAQAPAISTPAALEPQGAAPAAGAATEASRPRRMLHAVHVSRSTPADSKPSPAAGSDQPERAPELLARDVIPALVAAGEKEGIAAFPPPGTDPVKRGIVVPDDFELPEGYVRHHQATDDGKQLAAILMFSPDYEFLDEHGQPIALPDDRIVPPEMAPPGLPIRMLKLPKQER